MIPGLGCQTHAGPDVVNPGLAPGAMNISAQSYFITPGASPGLLQGLGPGLLQALAPGLLQGLGPGLLQALAPGLLQAIGRDHLNRLTPAVSPGLTELARNPGGLKLL